MGGRQVVSKYRIAVTMKIIEDRKRCNTVTAFDRLKTVRHMVEAVTQMR